MKIVPLTKDIIQELDGELPPQSVRGQALVDDDGKVLGAVGSYHNSGHVMVWMDIKPELREKPIALMKLCKSVAKLPHKIVYAYCDKQYEAAERFLKHFGFEDRGDGFFILEKRDG